MSQERDPRQERLDHEQRLADREQAAGDREQTLGDEEQERLDAEQARLDEVVAAGGDAPHRAEGQAALDLAQRMQDARQQAADHEQRGRDERQEILDAEQRDVEEIRAEARRRRRGAELRAHELKELRAEARRRQRAAELRVEAAYQRELNVQRRLREASKRVEAARRRSSRRESAVSHENVALVRLIWQRLNEPGLPWLDLCDERIEIRNPLEFPARGPFVGHAGARQWEAQIWEVFKDLRHDVREVIDVGDGEKVVSVQRTRGKLPHTELKVDIEWATVWTLRRGRALRARGYMSKAAALKAVGLRE